jgi:hypothetical protein
MASFRETLRQLFSRNVIIKRLPGDRLKAFDVNRSQSAGGNEMKYDRATRWRTGRNTYNGTGYGRGYSNEEMESLRKQMYIDYEEMDRDAILSSALDIYADESTTKSANNMLLTIKTQDERIKKLLYNLFYDILNIEFNLWSWIRNTAKYGDFFLYLDLREKFGVVNVIPIHPSLIVREEGAGEDPNAVQFVYQGDAMNGFNRSDGFDTYRDERTREANRSVFEPFEMAHFRLLTDTNFLPYGRSLIEPARKTYKQLSLMEDAMLLHRIMRAPERRVFKIDIGNIAPEEVDAYIEELVRTTKKTPYIDERTGDYNLKFNIQNMLEEVYIPVRGGQSGTEIETLPGLANEGAIDDVNYIKGKLLAALKIPKAFLGFEDSEAKATLAAEDIRFARTIERIQKIIVSELYKIAVIHLRVQGFEPEELLNFELELNNPSLIYERQKVDLLNEKMNLIGNILENNVFSWKYIYENILNLSEDEWKAEDERIIEDKKRQFRLKQIEEEGNDPKVTGKSFGTPHDLAALHAASRIDPGEDDVKKMYEPPDGRADNPGRPEKEGSFERAKDQDFGRDPVGRKEAQAAPQAAGASMEAFNRLGLKKLLKKEVEKSLLVNEQKESNIKMMDENSLFEELH